MDLFSTPPSLAEAPLAHRLRPRTLDDFVGQEALVGMDGPLRRMVEAGIVRSMILWGPPGVGKTTLAEILAEATGARLERLSAVMAGVKELREVVERARIGQPRGESTVLFLDEIHRLNKAQQDALLPHVESGIVALIGATTENPSFEVNSALLSRTRVYVLRPLEEDDLRRLLARALADTERGLGGRNIEAADGALRAIARAAGGDARRALGLLETAADFTRPCADGREHLDEATVAEISGHRGVRLDRQGDAYYDLLSAIHKSVRSSRPDAALVYIAWFIGGGGDPLDVVRRLTAIASEDVGNADPRALPLVIAAWDAYLRLGDAEGQRAIAHAAVHLSVAPKSNAVDRAWKAAQALVGEHPTLEVPAYLRNAPTALLEHLGHGQGYRFAHDEPNAYPAGRSHDCWPDGLPRRALYRPSDRGQERRYRELMEWRSGLDAEVDGAAGGGPGNEANGGT